MNIFFRTILCSFLLFFISTAQAETAAAPEQTQGNDQTDKPKQYYIVEVVLFRHLNEQGKSEEYWNRPDFVSANTLLGTDLTPTISTQNISNDTPALAQYDMQDRNFLTLRNGIAGLSSNNYKLTDSATHIKRSPNFRLLAHFGWTQLSLSKKRALPILLTSDKFSDSLTPSGELKLYVSRYLHLQVDMAATRCEHITAPVKAQISNAELDKQLENGASQEEALQLAAEIEQQNQKQALNQEIQEETPQCVNNVYRFKQQRKMRSKELHYLDNPLFGLLVYVTPFKASATN